MGNAVLHLDIWCDTMHLLASSSKCDEMLTALAAGAAGTAAGHAAAGKKGGRKKAGKGKKGGKPAAAATDEDEPLADFGPQLKVC